MLPQDISDGIDALEPLKKKIILEKLTILTNKYIHFMTGALHSRELGDQAVDLFERSITQISNQMIEAIEERKRRGVA